MRLIAGCSSKAQTLLLKIKIPIFSRVCSTAHAERAERRQLLDRTALPGSESPSRFWGFRSHRWRRLQFATRCFVLRTEKIVTLMPWFVNTLY